MQSNARWITVSLGLTAAFGAQAQVISTDDDRPWYVGARQEFGHFSNVRSTPDNVPALSDTVSRTSVSAGLDIPVSRQRVFFDATARHSRYHEADDLDNTGYDLRGGIDWQTVERLSGTVTVASTQSLARLNPGNAPIASTRNLERTKSADATARLGGAGQLALEGSLGYRKVDYSAPEFQFREYDQNRGSIGISYRPSGALTLRTGISAQRTTYPRFFETAPGVFEEDRSKRRDLYAGARWIASGASILDTRISYSRVEYERVTNTDFSGLTGLLSWAWQPTGKLQFVTTALRETGQEAGFATRLGATDTAPSATPGTSSGDPGAITTTTTPTSAAAAGVSASDYSRVTNALSVFANYQLTAKVRLNGGVSYARRNLADALGNSGNDRTTSLAFGVDWTPTRVLTFGCNVTRDQRSASTSLSSDYRGNYFGCFGQAVLN